jgi:hypothetical protein
VKFLQRYVVSITAIFDHLCLLTLQFLVKIQTKIKKPLTSKFPSRFLEDEKGDVPGWVLVVLMTTGLVTAIWTIAAPRLTAILRNSLDSMNGIR